MSEDNNINESLVFIHVVFGRDLFGISRHVTSLSNISVTDEVLDSQHKLNV